MELVRKMNVPVGFLYETIIKSVLADIHSQKGEKLSEKQLKGYEYVKTFSKNAKATIRIEDVSKDKFYQYRTSNSKNTFLVTYDIRQLTEDSCELHYSEKMESYGYLQQINDTVIGIIWSPLKKRKFKEMLRQIEATYSNQSY
ncbi:DUF3284 domain-containing protein [Amphibacillus sediminis]|uniref:DUF3284 domain-containing protein n=1 Tax=Amphibacillus sediminis TaxID=360185 RepID=UPI0008356C54|nr:DUF3284 domain-containing protein [Amphibacillus sediminis]